MTKTKMDEQSSRAALERAVELEAEEEEEEQPYQEVPADHVAREEGTASLSADDLEAIGAQAGIEARFVRAAIVEGRAGVGGTRAARALERMTELDRRALVRRTRLPGSASQVAKALVAVVTRVPFEFSLVDAQTDSPDSIELVMEVPLARLRSDAAMALVGAGVRRLHVCISTDSEGSAQLVARGDAHGAARYALVSGSVFGSVGGALGCFLATLLTRHLPPDAGALGVVLALSAFLLAVPIGALLGFAGARASARRSIEQAGEGISKVLAAVEVDLRALGKLRS